MAVCRRAGLFRQAEQVPVSFSNSIRYFTITCQHEACFASKTQTKSYQLWLQFCFFKTFSIATCLNYNIPNTYKEEKVPDGIIVTNNINKTEYSNIATNCLLVSQNECSQIYAHINVCLHMYLCVFQNCGCQHSWCRKHNGARTKRHEPTDLVRQMDLPQGSMLLAAAEFTKYKMQLLLLICRFHCSYTCRLKIKNTEDLIKWI